MKEYLSQKGISYEDMNVRDNPNAAKELVMKGSRSTPTILVGETMIIGFDKEKLDKALGLS